MAAYNKGDAKTLADFYSEDVDYIDQDGAEVKGRDGIQKLLAENFRANPGVKLDLTVEELKQLTPDVRVNRGTATVTPKDGAAVATRYIAIDVKNGERWLISSSPKRRRRHLTCVQLQALAAGQRKIGKTKPGTKIVEANSTCR